MRIISSSVFLDRIIQAIEYISFNPDPLIGLSLKDMLSQEQDDLVKDAVNSIIENADASRQDRIPLCQDTGTIVCFAEMGKEVHLEGELLFDILNRAVKIAYDRYFLRLSMVEEPLFERKNTLNNCPAILHTTITSGDKLTILIAQKGGGAENMSFHEMLNPSTSPKQIVDLVVETVKKAGSKACPPLILGIGLGGNFESVAINAKRAVFLPMNVRNPDPRYAQLEEDILGAVNATKIGVQGMGGAKTAFSVHIIQAPCHIASLPFAINLQCHAHRHISLTI